MPGKSSQHAVSSKAALLRLGLPLASIPTGRKAPCGVRAAAIAEVHNPRPIPRSYLGWRSLMRSCSGATACSCFASETWALRCKTSRLSASGSFSRSLVKIWASCAPRETETYAMRLLMRSLAPSSVSMWMSTRSAVCPGWNGSSRHSRGGGADAPGGRCSRSGRCPSSRPSGRRR